MHFLNDTYISLYFFSDCFEKNLIDKTILKLISSSSFKIPLDTDGFPSDNIIPPLNYDPGLDMYTMTAYFVDPGKPFKN